MPNAISVQIINPMPGWTRKLPPPSSSAATGRAAAMMEIGSIGLEEEGDQAEDERVERDGLGEGEAEPADALQLVRHLRLTRDRLDLLAEDDSDADAGSDRAESGTDAERDRLEPVFR